MSWSCDFDGPAVYSERELVARKEHECVECRAAILKGEKHLAYSGLWDGHWDKGRQHLLCRDACVWVRDQLEGECIPFGGLSDWWSEFRSSADVGPWKPVRDPKWAERWRIGAKMFAMIRRRERIDRAAVPT